MRSRALLSLLAAGLVFGARGVDAQTFTTDDPVIRAIWNQGMGAPSQVETLAQVLLDSIGPRLSGSPGQKNAIDWVAEMYRRWNVPVEQEQYGTWRGWRRGISHVDLLEPRVRALDGMMLAWSPPTNGRVEGEVVAFPDVSSAGAFRAWLPSVRGKFVAYTAAEPTCRAPESWAEHALPESVERMEALQEETSTAWRRSVQAAGGSGAVIGAIEEAGALGVLQGNWSDGWGANKIFSAPTSTIPAFHLSCEDYGLVHRLAENDQGPRVAVEADAEFLGETPVYNVIGTLRGNELPNEYVLLTAHLDSWDGASGATDNGSGTIMMMEAMRILKEVYPNPKRTIVVAHWGGEEQGLIGSGSYAADHPEVVDGLQAAFNQDNGTWRIDYIRMQGFVEAGQSFGKWFGKLPLEMSRQIELDIPGEPERGGSDHMSFICRQMPGFRLQSNYPDYRQYTWHTDIDTYDKLVFDDLRNNATLAAMLAYQASEDDERVSPAMRTLPDGQEWPACGTPRRSSGG